MKKRYLLTPGPTPVPEGALLAMAQPIMHHRTAEFEAILARVWSNLQYLFQTKEEVFFFSSSGTGAMEASVVNILSPGDKAICIRGGKFGERWTNIIQAYGGVPVNVDVPWGTAVNPQVVADLLAADPSIKAVYVQSSETSTAVKHDVQALARITAGYPDTLLVVDAITALGVFPLPMDEWGLDVVVTGSQKALMLPPGLSFIALSAKAWGHVAKARMPRFYFDLPREKKNKAKGTTAFTPAVSLLVGLDHALSMMREEGLENLYRRHATLARATREGFRAMGCALYAEGVHSDALTAVIVPEGVDGKKLVKHLSAKYGITVAGGQDQLAGKIIRVAHLGYYDRFDVMMALNAVEMALTDLGYAVPQPGKAASVAGAILAELP
jgi:aspartate aminotransferase-like enzyme